MFTQISLFQVMLLYLGLGNPSIPVISIFVSSLFQLVKSVYWSMESYHSALFHIKYLIFASNNPLPQQKYRSCIHTFSPFSHIVLVSELKIGIEREWLLAVIVNNLTAVQNKMLKWANFNRKFSNSNNGHLPRIVQHQTIFYSEFDSREELIQVQLSKRITM